MKKPSFLQKRSSTEITPSATEMEKPFVTAIVPAAGNARRMEGREKLFEEICGVPVLARTLHILGQSPWIRELVIVTRGDLMAAVTELLRAFAIDKVKAVVLGGENRQASVAAGVQAASRESAFYLIHDGARPFVTSQIIANTILDAMTSGVAAAAIPVTDTIKVTDGTGFVRETPDREHLYAVQTPQVLAVDVYRKGLAAAQERGLVLTDDCQLAELIGQPVRISRGAMENIKITRPLDLVLAQAMLENTEI